MPGRSQAFYLGKILKDKHGNLTREEIEVYSSPRNRCQETAKYFLLGWYGHNQTNDPNGVKF